MKYMAYLEKKLLLLKIQNLKDFRYTIFLHH